MNTGKAKETRCEPGIFNEGRTILHGHRDCRIAGDLARSSAKQALRWQSIAAAHPAAWLSSSAVALPGGT